MELRSADGAGGGEGADEVEGLAIVALAARSGAVVGRDEGGAEVGDEEGGFAESGKLAKPRHDFGASEERGGGGESEGGIPMEEAVARMVNKKFGEQSGGGGVKGGVGGFRLRWLSGDLVLEINQAEGDG